MVVYRIDQLPELNIMHCVDLYGSSSAYSAAISYLEEQAIHNNIDIIDFYSTNTRVNSIFIEKNWFSVLDYDFIDFPHLFHPLEMRTPSTTSLIMWCDNKVSGFYDVGKLYITKQDCDFDRPVASNL
ncbi:MULTISPECIES: hypothetical protein [unclassified Photobacterium]|uniref:hypothetical protein n=1 Tax=unclassified Photobacterium TaxID=2628852 RepID=UPI001EDF83BA|nr:MULTISPECIES: hypothetical protein [unclassified Photobacterium]MCG3864927.1 hypothetical protein [Photobacterium sp. Ph6]MCG3876335.1 hypothetical protein [Photobacterium sp. Ph5]